MDGIDVERVTNWLTEHVDGVQAPFDFTLVAGGRSNLTFTVTDAAGRKLVLRRPPLGQVLQSAHDVAREHRLISAVGRTDVPVPEALGLCTDPDVNGAAFYVMSFVDGVIARDATVAEPLLDEAARRRAGQSLVEVLAALHAVDPDAVGLGDLSRKDGYIARQLKRWHGQWEASKTRDIPAVEEAYERLAADIPEQGPAGIVHGDYRMDNCVAAPTGEIVAVLDWELCTLGDPLADLGMLLICWARPGDDAAATARPDSPTLLPGFPERDEVLAAYADASGRDVSRIDYYRAFQFWRLACISQGVYARYAGGAMGEQDVDLEVMALGAPRLAEAAVRALDDAR